VQTGASKSVSFEKKINSVSFKNSLKKVLKKSHMWIQAQHMHRIAEKSAWEHAQQSKHCLTDAGGSLLSKQQYPSVK